MGIGFALAVEGIAAIDILVNNAVMHVAPRCAWRRRGKIINVCSCRANWAARAQGPMPSPSAR
jgi:hypothetical protein